MVNRAKPSVVTRKEIWIRKVNRPQYFAMASLGPFTYYVLNRIVLILLELCTLIFG